MEIVLIVICGLLTSIGVYLILSKSLIRIIIVPHSCHMPLIYFYLQWED